MTHTVACKKSSHIRSLEGRSCKRSVDAALGDKEAVRRDDYTVSCRLVWEGNEQHIYTALLYKIPRRYFTENAVISQYTVLRGPAGGAENQDWN